MVRLVPGDDFRVSAPLKASSKETNLVSIITDLSGRFEEEALS